MYSHLALAEGGPGEDGLLEAWELMQLDLKADLAVLSPCETARGRIGAGEGMIGLSWAMFIAGQPSIVVSQWKVESAGTRDLMVDLHRSLIATKSKPTKTQALRQAALKLMKNPSTSHPTHSTGPVLCLSATESSHKKAQTKPQKAVLCLLLCLFVAYFRRAWTCLRSFKARSESGLARRRRRSSCSASFNKPASAYSTARVRWEEP
jgi:hypothetical protein